jgi:SH3-like domain-containing protein
MEKVKETTAEVKEATAEVVAELRPKVPLVSLRETLCREGFDDKRGWRRMLTLWDAINAPFCR